MLYLLLSAKRVIWRYLCHCVSMLIISVSPSVFAQSPQQSFLIEGTIENPERQGISGASLRITGTNQGTYSDGRGRFRLPSASKEVIVKISSLGYEAREILLSADSLQTIVLTPLPIRLQNVEVTAGISAEEIMRKAIQNKSQNLRTLQSLARRVYTKLQVSSSFKVIFDKPRTDKFMTETVAQVYEQFTPKRSSHTVILQRRQTANFPQQANITTITETVNLLDDEIVLGTTRLRSPLASTALSFYDYEISERKAYSGKSAQFNGNTVYVLHFKPKSRTFPGFEGTIAIIDGAFAPVAAEFTPSKTTALPAITDLRYAQTFEPFGDSTRALWLATYSRVSGSASANLGIADANFDLNLQSIVSNVEVSQSLPAAAVLPSATTSFRNIQRKNNPIRSAKLSDSSVITLAPTIDSVDMQFWKTAALLEYTAAEDSLYRATDSIAQARIKAGKRTITQIFDSTLTAAENTLFIQQSSIPYFTQNSLLRFQLGSATTLGFSPILMQPRTTGRVYGIETALDWNQSSVRADIMTSERWEWFGALRLVQRIVGNDVGGFAVIGDAFSRVRSFQPRPLEGLGWIGTATDFALFERHYDFYREEGFGVGIKGALGRLLEASITGQLLRTSAMSIPGSAPQHTRNNLAAANSDFRVLRGEIAWNPSAIAPSGAILTSDTTVFTARITGVMGEDILLPRPFTKWEASATLIQPTFFTGYAPMCLVLSARAGMASEFAPPQERFILFRRYPYLGNVGDFLTPEISSIGGTRMMSLRVEHNFSDIAWRACGLPTYKGRGLELIAHGGTALFEQNPTWQPSEGNPSASNGWYSELGFGIGRIPLFLIDFVTLRFDAAWSLGTNANAADTGRFGWSVAVQISL